MFEFEIIISASFVPLYQISMFFLRFQIDSFRRHSVAIFSKNVYSRQDSQYD